MVLYKLLPTKLSVAIKPLDGPVVNLSNWGFEWAGKSTWQLEQDHQMWSTLQRFILRDKYSAPVYSLVSQPLVVARVVLVRAAASSGSIATVSWLQLVTWSPASAPPPPRSAPSAPRSLSPAPSPGPAPAPGPGPAPAPAPQPRDLTSVLRVVTVAALAPLSPESERSRPPTMLSRDGRQVSSPPRSLVLVDLPAIIKDILSTNNKWYYLTIQI